MQPSQNDFINTLKQYGRAYLSIILQGDTETPISIFKKLYNKKGCFLLESVENGKDWGRFSHIGRNPFMELVCTGHSTELKRNNHIETLVGDPVQVMKQVLDSVKLPNENHIQGYFGGAVGYISYDIARYHKNIFFNKSDELETPDAHLVFPQEIISYDHEKKRIIITVHMTDEGNREHVYKTAQKKLESIKNEIMQGTPYHYKTCLPIENKIESNETKESFMKKVEKIKSHIYEGDIFQAVPSQRFCIHTEVDPFETYRSLRLINPSPYMYYMDFGDYVVVGSSPEMLAKIEDEYITTCPIAGTRPRGSSKAEDVAYEKSLLEDEKEIAEHVMLVDLARNDIGSVSEFNTIQLKEYMEIRRYSHVMHIVSLVQGRLKKGMHMLDGLFACMPAGTVSGAPKKRAMEIIDSLEENKRGIYAGAIGWFGFDGNMDTCIAIRTIIFKNNNAYIQAGAGIVADSVPESEYDETLRKAHALFETINSTGGLQNDSYY